MASDTQGHADNAPAVVTATVPTVALPLSTLTGVWRSKKEKGFYGGKRITIEGTTYKVEGVCTDGEVWYSTARPGFFGLQRTGKGSNFHLVTILNKNTLSVTRMSDGHAVVLSRVE